MSTKKRNWWTETKILRRVIYEIVQNDNTLYYGIDFSDQGFTISVARGRNTPTTVTFELNKESINNSFLKSAIYFPESEERPRIIGQMALAKEDFAPSRLVKNIENKIGLDEGKSYITWKGKDYHAEDLLRLILSRLKLRADKFLAFQPSKLSLWQPSFQTHAIITCPLGWSEEQRAALLRAIKIAGFKSGDVISKTIAAAIYWRSKQTIQVSEDIIVIQPGDSISDVALVSCATNLQGFAEVKIKAHRSIKKDIDNESDWQSKITAQIKSLCEPMGVSFKAIRTIIYIETNSDFTRVNPVKQWLRNEHSDLASVVNVFELSFGAVYYSSLRGEGLRQPINAYTGLKSSQKFTLKGIEASENSFTELSLTHDESLNAPGDLVQKLDSFNVQSSNVKNLEQLKLRDNGYHVDGRLEQGEHYEEFQQPVYQTISLLIAKDYEDFQPFLKQVIFAMFERKRSGRKNSYAPRIPFKFDIYGGGQARVNQLIDSLREAQKIIVSSSNNRRIEGFFIDETVEIFLTSGWLEKYCEIVIKYVLDEISLVDTKLDFEKCLYIFDAEHKIGGYEKPLHEYDSFLKVNDQTFLFECKSGEPDKWLDENFYDKYDQASRDFNSPKKKTFWLCSTITQFDLSCFKKQWNIPFSLVNLTNFYDVVKAVITDCIRKSKRS
jgi:hypothetical protein